MPEWFAQLLLGALLTVIGAIVLRIDRKLDRMEERQTQTEKNCVTWDEFNKLKADVTHQGTEIAVIKTTCEGKHGK